MRTYFNHMCFSIVSSLVFLTGCGKNGLENKSPQTLVEVTPSLLAFDVRFSAEELEAGINQVLPEVLVNDGMPMKDQEDTVFLEVKRKGSLDLAIVKNKLQTTIPLEIAASVSKKVFGLTFSNKDKPIRFDGVLRASVVMDLNSDWTMDLICSFEDFDLQDQTKISLMGFTFDAKETINKMLDRHRDEISDIICSSINRSFDLRSAISKVWKDIQNPIRILKTPGSLYLQNVPGSLAGKLVPNTDDEIRLHLEYKTVINVIGRNAQPRTIPLPDLSEPLSAESNIMAYPNLKLTYAEIGTMMNASLTGKSFEYSDYQLQIDQVDVERTGRKLKILLNTTGDINGLIVLTGVPHIDNDLTLSIKNLSYEIETEEQMVQSTDWALHELAEIYLAKKLKIELKPFLENLDDHIKQGISQSEVGDKIAVEFRVNAIERSEIRITKEYLQCIFLMRANGSLDLKRTLLATN